MGTSPPQWIKDAVFYQIFPDRFARSASATFIDNVKFKPWGSPPEEQGFQGGNLDGICEKLDYLRDLGINALYLTPVFASASNHRYHTYDYYSIDPLLGGNRAFKRLIKEIHSYNMHIILDGVFNHTGRGFWAFHHILENGINSPYVDWYKIKKWPLHAYDENGKQKANYSCWSDNRALPKLNLDNPALRKYLIDVVRYWTDMGIDGWRLDAPHEIERMDFWEDLHKAVKASNSNAYLCGEYWFVGDKFREDRKFDGLTNYPFSLNSLGFFARHTIKEDYENGPFKYNQLNSEQFSEGIENLYAEYPWENCCANMNILDSHDTGRALWTAGYDVSAIRLAVLFQMTMPGAPCVYYGDEIGLAGGPDPLCREAFPWNRESSWNVELLDYYRKVIDLRNMHRVLRQGSFMQLHAKDGVFIFLRNDQNNLAIVGFNADEIGRFVKISVSKIPALRRDFRNEWNKRAELKMIKNYIKIAIPARSGAVFISSIENTKI